MYCWSPACVHNMKDQEAIDLLCLALLISTLKGLFFSIWECIEATSQTSCLSLHLSCSGKLSIWWWRFPHGGLVAETTNLSYTMFNVFHPITKVELYFLTLPWMVCLFANAFCAPTLVLDLNAFFGFVFFSLNWTVCIYILPNHVHIAMPWYRNARLIETSTAFKASIQ